MNDSTATQLVDEVSSLAAVVLSVPRSQIDSRSTPEGIDNWDSIAHVTLVMAIEEHFGVSFKPEEIIRMESIARIAKLVSEKLSA
ncbi:MAG TPA: acyl carrier protein [Thermoanaerobaculia bacterium]